MRDRIARGQPGQHQVRVLCGQIAHGHGRDTERALCLGAKQRGGHAAGADITKDARAQAVVVKCRAIALRSMLRARRTIYIVKHHPWQALAGKTPRILGGMNMCSGVEHRA